MAYCEDAPCCGCCGPAVERADALAAEEAAFDRWNGDADEWDVPVWDECAGCGEDDAELDRAGFCAECAAAPADYVGREDFGWAGMTE